MVFQKKLKSIDEEIFEDYLTHLSRGYPACSWSYTSISKNIACTTHNLVTTIGAHTYNDDLVFVAKARGTETRRKAFVEALEDPKTTLSKLAVLKAVQEIFFAEMVHEKSEEGLLFEAVKTALANLPEADTP
jgi:hypothetical protein